MRNIISLFYRVICNPWVLAQAHRIRSYLDTELSQDNYQTLLGNILNYICMPETTDSGRLDFADNVVLKLPLFCIPQATVLNKVYSPVKHIFIAGHTRHSVLSLVKVREEYYC